MSFIRNTCSLEIAKFGLFRQFCVPKFSADIVSHEVASQSRALNLDVFKELLSCFFLDEVKKQKVADHLEDDKYTCCACGGATYDITFTGKAILMFHFNVTVFGPKLFPGSFLTPLTLWGPVSTF